MVANHYATFFDTPELAAQWVRDYTNLVEKDTGVFVTQEQSNEVGLEVEEQTLEVK